MSAVIPLETALEALPGPRRETILAFEAALKPLAEANPIDCEPTHTFAPGQYARTLVLPADSLIVGKIHKHAHLNIVSRGLVTVVTEFGRKTIDARQSPVIFTSEAGSKRALYVHEETTWTTVHSVQSTNLAEIERDIIAPDFAELDAFLAGVRGQLESPHEGDARIPLRPGSQSQLPAEL